MGDLAAAINWISAHLDMLGFESGATQSHERQQGPSQEVEQMRSDNLLRKDGQDGESSASQEGGDSRPDLPRVFLAGHSSGAHVALCYLIQCAKRYLDCSQRESESQGGESEAMHAQQPLEIEGLIGLSGVYDIHKHYLYESWR